MMGRFLDRSWSLLRFDIRTATCSDLQPMNSVRVSVLGQL